MLRLVYHRGFAAAVLALALSACGGGGGGGVNSTPAPSPSPMPTPTPTPSPTQTPAPTPVDAALGAASGSTTFTTFSTHTTQSLTAQDDVVSNTQVQRVPLTFRYDAGSKAYTVQVAGISTTFGAAQFAQANDSGDVRFTRTLDGGRESLTLFNPARVGAGTRSVNVGLWQRRTNTTDFQFDVFAYGFTTAAAQVPRSGSATYEIDLFGVASPNGAFPRSIIGDGTFSLDFAHGLFSMAGQAGEYNNDVAYSTCCTSWTGAGRITSAGALSGNFIFDGRDRISYRSSVVGALFGPDGKEVGGSLLGNDNSDSTFSGAFAGTYLRNGIANSLSVLDTSARSYSSFLGTSSVVQRKDATSSEGAGYYFPGTFGRIDFGANGSVTPVLNINDSRYFDVTFTAADRVAALSDASFDVYKVANANGNYQLEMYRPGSGNPDVALTYSSFGHWQEDRPIADATRQTVSTWFSYGARTLYATLPPTGTARFTAKVLGSGERLADMARLTLTGTSAINIDFATSKVDGTLDVTAVTAANERVILPLMTFASEGNAYTFDTQLYRQPGMTDGSIRASLYGPGGEEIGGSFEFFTRSAAGAADAVYSGVLFGKRN